MLIVHETSTKLKTRGTVNPNHHTKELQCNRFTYVNSKHTEHRIYNIHTDSSHKKITKVSIYTVTCHVKVEQVAI
jgi:hypothetical protein